MKLGLPKPAQLRAFPISTLSFQLLWSKIPHIPIYLHDSFRLWLLLSISTAINLDSGTNMSHLNYFNSFFPTLLPLLPSLQFINLQNLKLSTIYSSSHFYNLKSSFSPPCPFFSRHSGHQDLTATDIRLAFFSFRSSVLKYPFQGDLLHRDWGTVIPWYLQGTCSRTPQIPKSIMFKFLI